MIQPVLLGGLFIGVLSALPIINIANCCCLWITGGGVLAGYLAHQNDVASGHAPSGLSRKPLTPLSGALVGLAAGMVGAFVWLIATLALDVVVAPLQERMVAEMVSSAPDMPPEVRAWLELLADRASSPFRLVAGFLFQLLAGVVFATLGGLLAAVFFRRNLPPAVGGDPIVPPPLPRD